jgi:hypothetical protein
MAVHKVDLINQLKAAFANCEATKAPKPKDKDKRKMRTALKGEAINPPFKPKTAPKAPAETAAGEASYTMGEALKRAIEEAAQESRAVALLRQTGKLNFEDIVKDSLS